MILQIADLLSAQQVADIHASLAAEPQAFSSGKATAGWYVKDIKHNDQAAGPAAAAAVEAAQKALLGHAVFKSAARPKEFVKLLVSRYKPGMAYGSHVDDALMNGRRTDMSFTLFLSDPSAYDGGELVIEENDGDSSIKLPAGHLVLYQTTSLHHVTEVTRGERIAIVGWVRSYIRSPEQRELLFELDQTITALRQTETPRAISDKVFKVRNSLTRMWAED
ncbi:MAG: Fe2+-dependent dioxygenase [Proteobacteria bacterium]|nr:Fe2+-dependent dioxygenase [Pseudomonadota bacterium]